MRFFSIMCCICCVSGLFAADKVPERSRLQPLFDTPLRATSVCKGADGRWYLTGTVAGADGSFQNNDGIWLWASDDCQDWQELGQVWSIAEGGSAWQQEQRINPDAPAGELVRGMVAPEIHHFRDTYWITYSMNGQGTGLLKSSSGTAAGPYEDLGQITAEGSDASIFVDDDDTVYWVVGQGFIAPMKDDCTALAAKPTLLRPAPWEPVKHAGHKMPFTQAPRTIGVAGAQVFQHGGRYWLMGAQIRDRIGVGCYDTFICGADSLIGPYDQAYLMINHGGQSDVFIGPDDQLWATFGGRDRKAIFQDRPAILSLVTDDASLPYGSGKRQPWPRKAQTLITEFGPWAEMEPCLPVNIRDLQFMVAPDGYAYLTGSGTDNDYAGKIMLMRSRNMRDWDPVEVQFDPMQLPEMTQEAYDTRFVQMKNKGLSDKYMDGEVYYAADTFHIFATLYSIKPSRWNDLKKPIPGWGMWLRSTSGKAEGPYEYVDRSPSQNSAFQDDDGQWYIFFNGNLMPWDPSGDTCGDSSKRVQLQTEMGTRLPAGDVATNLAKIHGKYVIFATGWNGAVIGENERVAATYDKVIWQSDTLMGPYEMPRYQDCLPHAGHSCPVQQGPDGRWYGLLFGNDSTSPWWCMPGVLIYDVSLAEDGYIRFDLKDELP